MHWWMFEKHDHKRRAPLPREAWHPHLDALIDTGGRKVEYVVAPANAERADPALLRPPPDTGAA